MNVFWRTMNNHDILIPVLGSVAFLLIQFHAFGINKRLDAVLELLDLERLMNPENPENKPVENRGGPV